MKDIQRKKKNYRNLLIKTTISTRSYLRASEEIMKFLYKFEDYFEIPTLDSNVMKIGIGHIQDDIPDISRINMRDAVRLFRTDLEEYEDYLNKWFGFLINCQFDALLSLLMDIGLDQFKNTMIPYELDQKRSNIIPRYMLELKMTPEKLNRRRREVNIFIGESFSRPVFFGKRGRFSKALKNSYIL